MNNYLKYTKIYSGNQLTKTSDMEDIDEDESPIDILLSKNKIEYVYENDNNNQSTSTTVTSEIVDDTNITRPTF